MTHGLGAKPHVPDPRDWLYRDIPEVKKRVAMPAVDAKQVWWGMHAPNFRINQYSTGTCTAMSCTNHFLDAPKPHYAFPRFATELDAETFAREAYVAYSGDTSLQDGWYTRETFDWFIEQGYASAYYALRSVDEIIDALRRQPVLMASAWYKSMFSPRFPRWTSNAYLNVDQSSGIAGYHQYLLNGFNLNPSNDIEGSDNRPFVRMHNSWGTWGKNGTVRVFLDDLPLIGWHAYVLTETTF